VKMLSLGIYLMDRQEAQRKLLNTVLKFALPANSLEKIAKPVVSVDAL